MDKINILIIAIIVLIFIGFIGKETFALREPPHFLRRLGLSLPYCPFRDQYY
jgi:uncharacterized membrane protein